MFGKALCKCGVHTWSAVEPGSVHLTNSDFPMIGVLWAQIGTRKCTRTGCTATQQVVREGEHGYDGLNVYAGSCYQLTSLDVTRGWGHSHLNPKEVLDLDLYNHSIALDRLGVSMAR